MMGHREFDRGKRTIRVHERPEEPPDAADRPAELRASAWCGREGCPRVVLTATTVAELRLLEWGYRCSRCGAPDPAADAEQRRYHAGGRRG